MDISLDINKNVDENASIYFDKSKKAKKKLEGAKKALDVSKELFRKEELSASIKIENENKKKSELSRKKEWYEKFRWFFSSDGFLVIGGRDANSNEIIIKKHANSEDSIFHTESSGSPFVVIKNPDKLIIPETTKIEAAVYTAVFSKAWSINTRTSEVFEVSLDQVSKEANSGEFIAKGAFMIRGKKKFYNPVMDLCVGYFLDAENNKVIMGGPPSAVKKRCVDFVVVKQGNLKKGEVSKILMKKFKLHSNDDLLSALPSGSFALNLKEVKK
ncbi:NFACT RNA binding domain-containing protein [Candidatus Woesearchaeota archaeon]|nr:NFACT RNA binding domain-containing protein [Candidatus Woesearchaeota archaeon]MCF7900714.1 NFACT RNA binding domain-containing protein [Candidatus Woesearchaeota archaeon]MCF8013235.1 NFACT RNA binding domain-containing protein [Candidatus Woesearchaeota archaeon]